MARRWQLVLVLAAAAEIAVLLAFVPGPPGEREPEAAPAVAGLRVAAAQLRGDGLRADFAADYIGARALVHGGDPYPVLTPAFAEIGLDWPRAEHRSPHPPTALLLAVPLVPFDWPTAAAAWAALMLLAIAVTWWSLGVPLGAALALAPLTLLWPPAAWSLNQLTPLWLLGLALAWRWRHRAGLAGAAVALASLTKFLPALSLVAFRREWRRAALGFAGVWAAALGLVSALDPGVIPRYVEAGSEAAAEQVDRVGNSALLRYADHELGIGGILAVIGLVLLAAGPAVLRSCQGQELDRRSWDALAWAGIALLPIAWIYSLLPLLPALVRVLLNGGWLPRLLALPTLVTPLVVAPFHFDSVRELALAVAWFGVALAVAEHMPDRFRYLVAERAATSRQPNAGASASSSST